MEVKNCIKCGLEKPNTNEFFVKNKKAKQGLHSWCKSCFKERGKTYYKKHKNKWKVKRYKKRYGIENLPTEANCEICNKKLKFDSLGHDGFCVDHCHETGQNRGYLCNHCNRALGLVGDKIEILENAIDYLKKYKNE